MIYVMADIHGEYDLFRQMLRAIHFSEKDTLYICGDIIDKGDASVRLLSYIAQTPNIHCIIGNHEDAFLKYYRARMEQADSADAVLEELKTYFSDGAHLDWNLIDYLELLPYYIETDDFICVHAGIPILESGELMPLSQASEDFLLQDRKFKERGVGQSAKKCVFFGHTQTDCVCGEAKVLAYLRKNMSAPYKIGDFYKVHLDTGAWSNGVLACFCVESCKVYYVRK